METQMRQRVFTGVVTQLQDHHGMVDQEVHFQMSDVIGRVPVVGEKVLVKAVLDPSQSINWTAQRVQTLNGQPFKSPPPLLPSMSTNQKPGILGSKPQPLLKSPKIPPLIPSMQPNAAGLLQMPHHHPLPWTGQYEGWGGGSRKRHGDVLGGRRGGRWEDSGAWGGDGLHTKRRRWRPMPGEDAEKRNTSSAQHGSVLFSCFPRDSTACGCLEVQRRYPHLHVPTSLFHLQLCWPESFPPNQPLPLSGPCLFHLGPSQPEVQDASPESTDSSFTVKVILLSMPSVEDFYAKCCNQSDDSHGTQGGAVHPTTLFKFLLVENGGELQLPGGVWSPKADGANPTKDETTLIHTAVRCVKAQTALDLGACTQWHKVAELSYLCEKKLEKVVFLLPDVWNLVPTQEEWASSQAEANTEEKGESSLPDVPSLSAHPSPGLNLSTSSLSSLLESRSSDTMEAFQVCLMGELFSEMLQRDFGLQLYHCLCRLPPTSVCSKAKVDESEDSTTATEGEPKKQTRKESKKGAKDPRKKRGSRDKGDEKEKAEEVESKDEGMEPEAQADDDLSSHVSTVAEPEAEPVSEEGMTSDVSENQPTNDSEKEEREKDRPLGWCVELPRRVLLSWVFFDRHLVGSLREQDLQNILLSLGLYLTPAQVQELVRKTSVGGQCAYRKLCSHWTEADEVDTDASAEGNGALLPNRMCKERGPSRRSASSNTSDVISYKGTIVNIPNLLQSLESCKTNQHYLEKQVSSLQARLAAVESEEGSQQQEELQSRLTRAETLSRAYEKSLKENTGHMIALIDRMQKMVDQTTRLTEAKTPKDDED